MALEWLLNSAFTPVFGHADNLRVHSSDVLASPNDQGHVQECLESFKDAKEGLAGILPN